MTSRSVSIAGLSKCGNCGEKGSASVMVMTTNVPIGKVELRRNSIPTDLNALGMMV